MKEKFKSSILFIFLIFISNTLLALTLNKMQVNSKQDEPLNAVIDVIYSKGDKAENLKPAIASKENYEANGLSRLPIHSDIQIRLEDEDGANGGKIFLISDDVVKDPFLDLLIQIDSEKGRVYKEYTVLLEPPSPKTTIKEVIEAKSKKEEAVAKKEEVEKIKTEPVKKSQQDISAVKKNNNVNEVKKPNEQKEVKFRMVKSKKSKTLYQISRENKPSGVTTEQMVLAIYQNNPEAFSEKNVNTLINNKKLKIPPLDYFQKHSHLEARKILRVQNIEWKEKLKKLNKPIKQTKTINNDTAKINQLEKELLETKKKLKDISRLNIESKKNSIKELNTQVKENLEVPKDEQSPKQEVSQAQVEEVDDGVFVSSISDLDETKIDETKIDITENKGLETIHVLLLILFVVLLFGLFIVTSRRKASERNQTLKSFVDDNGPISKSFNEDHDNYTPADYTEELNDADSNKSDEKSSVKNKKNYLPIADDD
jgi:FimV-like protein